MERAVPVLPGDSVQSAKDFYVNRLGCATLEVTNADAHYNEWKDKVPLRRPPINEPWGGRTFGVQVLGVSRLSTDTLFRSLLAQSCRRITSRSKEPARLTLA